MLSCMPGFKAVCWSGGAVPGVDVGTMVVPEVGSSGVLGGGLDGASAGAELGPVTCSS